MFDIWGLSPLLMSDLTVDHIKAFLPTQSLTLVLNFYLKAVSPALNLSVTTKKAVGSGHVPSPTTTFPSIGVTINHDWADTDYEQQVKSDSAPVPSSLWDKRLEASFPDRRGLTMLIRCLRMLSLLRYRRLLLGSFLTYLRRSFPEQWLSYCQGSRTSHHGGDFCKSIEGGRDVIRKAANSTWFEWNAGSTLIFWRWGKYLSEARDGFPLFIIQDLKKLDRLVIPSTPLDNPKLRKLYVEKIRRIILANYIMPGFVKRDIRCFGVSKGDDDV